MQANARKYKQPARFPQGGGERNTRQQTLEELCERRRQKKKDDQAVVDITSEEDDPKQRDPERGEAENLKQMEKEGPFRRRGDGVGGHKCTGGGYTR